MMLFDRRDLDHAHLAVSCGMAEITTTRGTTDNLALGYILITLSTTISPSCDRSMVIITGEEHHVSSPFPISWKIHGKPARWSAFSTLAEMSKKLA